MQKSGWKALDNSGALVEENSDQRDNLGELAVCLIQDFFPVDSNGNGREPAIERIDIGAPSVALLLQFVNEGKQHFIFCAFIIWSIGDNVYDAVIFAKSLAGILLGEKSVPAGMETPPSWNDLYGRLSTEIAREIF